MVTATRRPSRPRGRRPAEIAAAVRPIADDVASSHGLVLWGITFLRDAGRETLRIAVDRTGGVNADELASYSEQLSRELDRSDVVPGDARYVLEVTSPGAERKLEGAEQFRICIGRTAKVTLSDGRTIEGPIEGVSEHAVEIGGEDGPVRALFSDVAKAQLVVKI
jgi:ribosome maturation factor RimP